MQNKCLLFNSSKLYHHNLIGNFKPLPFLSKLCISNLFLIEYHTKSQYKDKMWTNYFARVKHEALISTPNCVIVRIWNYTSTVLTALWSSELPLECTLSSSPSLFLQTLPNFFHRLARTPLFIPNFCVKFLWVFFFFFCSFDKTPAIPNYRRETFIVAFSFEGYRPQSLMSFILGQWETRTP